MCEICYVDEEMKEKIIAYGAEFHKVTQKSVRERTTKSACCI